jgi:hypothetical protein
MIISGGSSGGASRDVGVFGRNETVYSVSIPMGDAGGGPDWTMQYALLTPEQNGNGLPVPPLARKKSVATMSSSALSMQTEPVLITAIIDEQGRLQAMKSVRAQDGRRRRRFARYSSGSSCLRSLMAGQWQQRYCWAFLWQSCNSSAQVGRQSSAN